MDASYAGLWKSFLKENLGFPSQRQCIIRDWRLGLTFRSLQVLIFVYLIHLLVVKKQYRVQHAPHAEFSFFLDQDDALEEQSRAVAQVRDGSHPYCTRAALDAVNFTWGPTRAYRVDSCEVLPRNRAFNKLSPTAMFIPLYKTDTIEHRLPAPQNATSASCAELYRARKGELSWPEYGVEGCEAAAGSRRRNSRFSVTKEAADTLFDVGPGAGDEGSCVCTVQRSVFVAAVEGLNFTIYHSHDVPEDPAYARASNVDTYIRRRGSEENLGSFLDASFVQLSLEQLLGLAGVDLDAAATEAPNAEWFEAALAPGLQGPAGARAGRFPVPRMTGVHLNLRFNYYNYMSRLGGRKFPDNLGPGQTVCILELDPVMMWNSMDAPEADLPAPDANLKTLRGSYSSYQYGITLELTSGGAVSKFDVGVLVDTLVNAYVLSQSAQTLVLLIAVYCLGARVSSMYKELLEEHLDISQLYRQFAVRSIVASAVFDLIDDDCNGSIQKRELHDVVSNIYVRDTRLLSEADAHTCVEFMCHAPVTTGADVELKMRKERQSLRRRRHKGQGALGCLHSGGAADLESPSTVGSPLSIASPHPARSKPATLLGVLANPMGEARAAMNKQLLRFQSYKVANMTRAQWVEAFTGKPCSVAGLVRLLRHKQDIGRFPVDPHEYAAALKSPAALSHDLLAQLPVSGQPEAVEPPLYGQFKFIHYARQQFRWAVEEVRAGVSYNDNKSRRAWWSAVHQTLAGLKHVGPPPPDQPLAGPTATAAPPAAGSTPAPRWPDAPSPLVNTAASEQGDEKVRRLERAFSEISSAEASSNPITPLRIDTDTDPQSGMSSGNEKRVQGFARAKEVESLLQVIAANQQELARTQKVLGQTLLELDQQRVELQTTRAQLQVLQEESQARAHPGGPMQTSNPLLMPDQESVVDRLSDILSPTDGHVPEPTPALSPRLEGEGAPARAAMSPRTARTEATHVAALPEGAAANRHHEASRRFEQTAQQFATDDGPVTETLAVKYAMAAHRVSRGDEFGHTDRGQEHHQHRHRPRHRYSNLHAHEYEERGRERERSAGLGSDRPPAARRHGPAEMLPRVAHPSPQRGRAASAPAGALLATERRSPWGSAMDPPAVDIPRHPRHAGRDGHRYHHRDRGLDHAHRPPAEAMEPSHHPHR